MDPRQMKMICGFCEEQEVVTPLCRDIETDLRLHVHSAHLKGTVNINPTKVNLRVHHHLCFSHMWEHFFFLY
jgi:hypothetical protein